MSPIIGITPSPTTDDMPHGTFRRHAMAAAYIDAVVDAGGIPIVIPPQLANVSSLLDLLDGLLLSGGGDIEPWRFGADHVHPTTYGLDPERDAFELELTHAAIDRDLPLLGICRGIQVLNVALGGTLLQDVGDGASTGTVPHRQHTRGLSAHDIGHQVSLDQTPFRAIYPETNIGVNSFHHQAIDRLAPNLLAAAHASDGIVEAVVLPDRQFAVGVQWHPELMVGRHAEQRRLFAALVSAAAARRRVGAVA